MIDEVTKWGPLFLSGLAIATSGLSYAWHLWDRSDREARLRRASRVFIDARIARTYSPLDERVRDHDLQLELLTALEADRHARMAPAPRLRIHGTDGPDAAA